MQGREMRVKKKKKQLIELAGTQTLINNILTRN